jgi:hypothetical protein
MQRSGTSTSGNTGTSCGQHFTLLLPITLLGAVSCDSSVFSANADASNIETLSDKTEAAEAAEAVVAAAVEAGLQCYPLLQCHPLLQEARVTTTTVPRLFGGSRFYRGPSTGKRRTSSPCTTMRRRRQVLTDRLYSHIVLLCTVLMHCTPALYSHTLYSIHCTHALLLPHRLPRISGRDLES